MAVAFVALLAALSGTATALQGKNTVDSGDIKNGAVKSGDIKNGGVASKDIKNGGVATDDLKNNDVRTGDVRDNTLTGTDINESSLGQVPSANTANSANSANTANSANSANTANTANSANSANTANRVDGFQLSGQARLLGGADATLFRAGGFRVELRCHPTGTGGAGDTVWGSIEVVNESAGNDSHFYSGWYGNSDVDLDEGETAGFPVMDSGYVAGEQSQDGYPASALGSNGSTLFVHGSVSDQPDAGFGGAECVGAAVGFGG